MMTDLQTLNHNMKLSTTLIKQPDGEPIKNGTVKEILSVYHPDCLIKVIVDGELRDVKEIRQVSTGTNEPIVHAFVVSD